MSPTVRKTKESLNIRSPKIFAMFCTVAKQELSKPFPVSTSRPPPGAIELNDAGTGNEVTRVFVTRACAGGMIT